jgi:hypothetical protein
MRSVSASKPSRRSAQTTVDGPGAAWRDPRSRRYAAFPRARVWTSAVVRRFGAKPDKKIVDRSSGKSEFMEDTVHGNSDGMVVGVDRFWVVRAAGWAEWLSGGEKGFDGFVSENEQRGHRPQTGW